MRKVLVVIDMQNDFIDGALGTKEAQVMLPRLVEKLEREEAPAALVDGHGHHAAPEEADDDCYKNKGRADELRHEADDDRLDDEARPRYEMVDDGAANEPAHADGVEQQHDDAHPTQ